MRLVAFGSVFILVHAEGSVRSKIAIKFVKVRFLWLVYPISPNVLNVNATPIQIELASRQTFKCPAISVPIKSRQISRSWLLICRSISLSKLALN